MGTDDVFKMRRQSNQERLAKLQKERAQTWLIVCEGEKTEPLYFNALHKYLKSTLGEDFNLKFEIHGRGNNTKSLVEKVERLIDTTAGLVKRKSLSYAEIFVVFDKDDFPNEHFNTAIQRCLEKSYTPIWSNECFEIWYILHYEYFQSQTGRKKYFEKLSTKLRYDYETVGKADPSIFDRIKDSTPQAIKNAIKLNSSLCCGTKYSEYAPCTMMPVFFERLQDEILRRTGKRYFY